MFRKLFLVLACIGFCSLYSFDQSTLPEPYRSCKLMPFNPHGWYGVRDGVQMLLSKYKVKNIVEIGSWMGASTRDMASSIPEDGVVYAIDTWLGTPGDLAHTPELVANLYDQFLSNVIHAGLTHKIVPIQMESLEAAKVFHTERTIDLIFLDATHTYEAAIKDLEAWFPLIKGHGVFCGDDWGWGDGGVGRAVKEFAKKNHIKFHVLNGWFWYLEE